MASVLGRRVPAAPDKGRGRSPSGRPAGHLRDINVLQGQSEVSDALETCLTTILGSCVAVCLHDPDAKVAGMNHFLLPIVSSGAGGTLNPRSGVHVMELLINGMLKLGARKTHMTAKVLGGAMMLESQRNVGARNADFALGVLRNEGIEVLGTHVGGTRARRLRFEVATGNLHVQLLKPAADLVRREAAVKAPKFESGTLDLF